MARAGLPGQLVPGCCCGVLLLLLLPLLTCWL